MLIPYKPWKNRQRIIEGKQFSENKHHGQNGYSQDWFGSRTEQSKTEYSIEHVDVLGRTRLFVTLGYFADLVACRRETDQTVKGALNVIEQLLLVCRFGWEWWQAGFLRAIVVDQALRF